jgi:dihydropteroate synthase
LDPVNSPVLLFAVSRKRFLQFYVGEKMPLERDQISAVLAKEACQAGFQIIRTHNVSLTKQILCG